MAIPDLYDFLYMLDEALESKTVRQAKEIVRRGGVTDLLTSSMDEGKWLLRATVLDTRGRQLSPEIELSGDPDLGLDFIGSCPCSRYGDCLHVAAILVSLVQSEALFHNAFRPMSVDPAADPAAEGRSPAARRKSKRAAAPPPEDLSDPAVLGWIQALAAAAQAPASGSDTSVDTRGKRRFLYVLKEGKRGLVVVPRTGLPHGKYRWNSIQIAAWSRIDRDEALKNSLDPEDRAVVRELLARQASVLVENLALDGPGSGPLLQRIVATGRAFWNNVTPSTLALTLADPLAGTPGWKRTADGLQQAELRLADPVAQLLPVSPLWYLAGNKEACGPVTTGLPEPVAAAWLAAPKVAPDQTSRVATAFRTEFPGIPLPTPEVFQVETVTTFEPVPVLTLAGANLQPNSRAYLWEIHAETKSIGVARLDFEYDGHLVPAQATAPFLAVESGTTIRRILRKPRSEDAALRILANSGLVPVPDAYPSYQAQGMTHARTAVPAARWVEFLRNVVPELRNLGWRVVEAPTFQWRLVEPEEWFSDARPDRAPKGSQEDWFGVELGVVVEGERVNLLPLLVELLKTDRDALHPSRLASLPHGLPLPLPNGKTLLFPLDRARGMLGILVDLFEQPNLGKDGRLRLSRLRAAELAGEADWRWLGPSDLAALASRLRDFRGIQAVPPPPGLAAELRPYQQDGLNWLQFLREHELGGILADDMGLGKTVQAIAHLLAEKISGRATGPHLVVAPTSLMTNWRQECERFAPALKVLVLHGQDRKEHFDAIPSHDVVLTTYPLLPRDLAHLLPHDFHCLVLDEAQYIKNPKTGAAQAVHQLKARHRLCLTGTPLENHLGELWSLFHFLMPGFLGDDLSFNRVFRKPIEKDGQTDRRQLLARRVGPFLLRRRKQEVARELPAKTEIIQNVELSGAQRDLYETVRLAMHERVKQEIDRNGVSRSHIIILDALLKLRQICCHPRLLSLEAARNVTESAKTELLFELVPSLIEDGRRILLFSQFTSMLELIEAELTSRDIPYVLLTGQTQDRATPIQRFQSGEVPLFLLSLKAGGTGLNLTAADTVIHYDPWWNPAVENQATDRAHRIGQDKQVFVYKLLTVGTVEEKISALQARKRELVEGLLDGSRPDQLQITAEDLDVLFAPVR